MARKKQKAEKTPLEIYQLISQITVHSVKRFCDYGIVSDAGSLAIKKVLLENNMCLYPDHQEIDAELARYITDDTINNFLYISNISRLIYVHSILDTYLTDTTKILLLMHPNLLAKDMDISFAKILQADSKNMLINAVVSDKVRRVSFETIKERIKFLNTHFKLNIVLSNELYKKLEYYNQLRNTFVHDNLLCKIELTGRGKPSISLTKCIFRPTGISHEDSNKALSTYGVIIGKIYEAVRTTIFKGTPINEKDRSLLEFLSETIETNLGKTS